MKTGCGAEIALFLLLLLLCFAGLFNLTLRRFISSV